MVEIISWIGGLTGLVSFIGFIAFYSLDRKEKRARIRVQEADGDIKSLSFLTALVETLKKENEELKRRIKAVEDELAKMKEENGSIWAKLKIYILALKCRPECNKKKCPIEDKFKELGGEK